ncbi:hypothetical protein G7070_05685 [Propioniciclava coleopterorum]|uniref:Serine/threonine protein kinase n=1 Tax=Propioniciclava coleopterorum TaxID=2714937 RepID=A0A6G7Y570_9ACTN|nr:hypothetical protein [Propioniciclava coleopterorum]QIK71859.1 hypothetical protein G7070_05685 [Propioniciclava coleopterorum]
MKTAPSLAALSLLCLITACAGPAPAPASPASTPTPSAPTSTLTASPTSPTPSAASSASASPSATPPATVAPSPAGTTRSPSPERPTAAGLVLGADLPGKADEGLGTAKPRTVDFGNHPTTILRGITWKSWGGDTATGTAEAMWLAPGKPTAEATWEKATVTASRPGTCGGKRAYTRLTWRFPGKSGEQPIPFNACTGEGIY